jgi:hypothetical protein
MLCAYSCLATFADAILAIDVSFALDLDSKRLVRQLGEALGAFRWLEHSSTALPHQDEGVHR